MRRSTGVLENAQDCHDAGYGDGRDSPFDGGANDICKQFTDDQGNPYYSGFSLRRRQYYGCLRVSYGLTMWEQMLSLTVDCGNGCNSEEKLLERVFVSLFTSSRK